MVLRRYLSLTDIQSGGRCYTTGKTRKQWNQYDSDLPTPRPPCVSMVVYFLCEQWGGYNESL